MKYLRYVFLPILLVSVLFVGVLFVGGCQQKDEWKPTDLNFVAMSVNNLGDALNNEEQLKLLYVDLSLEAASILAIAGLDFTSGSWARYILSLH